MEDLAARPEMIGQGIPSPAGVYGGRRVLVVGHTGFKGSWLTLWLASVGAEVTGFALPPEDGRSLFVDAGVAASCRHVEADIRDLDSLVRVVSEVRPEFVFHLAAQSLVRRGYQQPLPTFQTNVLGTANVLEAIRRIGSPCSVIVVTSDKCYEDVGRSTPHSEIDRLGGRDPYSASKAAAEMVASSYRSSFFPPGRLREHGVAVATARSGNVIGGGDWSEDRIVPDAMRALERGLPIRVRNPEFVRPWQHVLDPLDGYLVLGARLAAGEPEFCDAWNFGPDRADSRTVRELVEEVLRQWGGGTWVPAEEQSPPSEATYLALAIDKARDRLSWSSRWGFEEAVQRTVHWYRGAMGRTSPGAIADLCLAQIAEHARVPV